VVAAALPLSTKASAGAFDGRWVLVQRMTTSASIPVVGDVEATTTVVSLHDLVDADGRLKGRGSLCRMTLDSGSSVVTTVLPKAFRRSIPRPVLDAELVVEEGVVKIKQPRRTVVVGAKLEAPETDALPTKSDDPRVFDQDRDDKPGVTIRVEGLVNGSMYIVQRSWTRFDGAFLTDGTFGGRLAFGTEQVVLGSTSPFLGEPPKSKPVPAKSWFRIARLEQDATCKDARRVAEGYL
jgi:hypothetical protein